MSARQDLFNHIEQEAAFDSAAVSTNTTTAGNIIDTIDFNSLTFLLNCTAYTDGTYKMTITEGDVANLSDGATATLVIGDTSAISVTAINTPVRLGYVGNKRYARLNIVSTATTTGATLSAIAVKGHATEVPTTNN